jgi:hypothetical protein
MASSEPDAPACCATTREQLGVALGNLGKLKTKIIDTNRLLQRYREVEAGIRHLLFDVSGCFFGV